MNPNSSRDFYIREDEVSPWYGPLSLLEAKRHAIVLTRDGTPANVKYAMVGTIIGEREGDPVTLASRMAVFRIYINGKYTLGGRAAEYNSTRLMPIPWRTNSRLRTQGGNNLVTQDGDPIDLNF